jgi:carbonic anhydrase
LALRFQFRGLRVSLSHLQTTLLAAFGQKDGIIHMQKLIDGIHRFQNGAFGRHEELFHKLALGQSPDTLFITCSDSRIDPALIMQSDPGELFIIRNAGNLVPPYNHDPSGEAATIEYAVEVLGVKDIIVCGHSHCGAMKAVLDPASIAELPAVRGWLTSAHATRRIMKAHYDHLEPEKKLSVCVKENVLVQLENLRTHPSVLAGLTQGRISLHAWTYRIDTGEVLGFNPDEGQYLPIEKAGRGVPTPVELLSREP